MTALAVVLAVLAYLAVALFAARRFFYAIRNDDLMAPEGALDAALMATLAAIAGLFWPLAIPVAIVMWKPRKTPAELQQEITERNIRIAELEAENDRLRRTQP